MKRMLTLMGLGLFVLLFTGCASSHSSMQMDYSQKKSSVEKNGKTVFIRTVNDARYFEDDSMLPEVPSIVRDGKMLVTEEEKSRVFGRKKRGFGKNTGCWLLEDGTTVQSLMKDMIENTFYNMGYTVLQNEQDVKPDTEIIDVDIDKFWFWRISGGSIWLNMEVKTTLNIEAPAKRTIKVEGFQKRATQVAANSKYKKVIDECLQKYCADLRDKI